MIDNFFDSIYPRGNTHELTLDWILQKVKECVAGWESTDTRFKSVEDAIEELVKWFTSFNNSPIFVAKIRDALQTMYDNGQLEELLRSIVDINVYETEYIRFGRVPTPNGFFTGRPFAWIQSAIQNSMFKDVIKIGANTFKHCINGLSDCIGIGTGVMSENQVGHHNIGIGMFALSNLKGSGDSSGTRNIAIGSYAYLFAKNLRKSIGIGRDVAQNVVEGENNTIVGYNAMGGSAPVGLDGQVINEVEIGAEKTTLLGAYNFTRTNDINNTVGVGAFCCNEAKHSIKNVVIGTNALMTFGHDISIHNKLLDYTEQSGTYIARGSNITVSIAGNHAIAGNYVRIKFTSGGLSEETSSQQLLYCSEMGDPEFVLITPYDNMFADGSCTVYVYETNDTHDYDFIENVVIGTNVGQNLNRLHRSTLIGSDALLNTRSANLSTVLGRNIGYDNLESIDTTIAIGNGAISTTTSAQWDVHIGTAAGCAYAHSNRNTSIGHHAGWKMVDGTTGVDVANSTCLGAGSSVSGSYQVQLGNETTTPYAYNALQVRSDRRDKTEIRDTVLGLDFINKLRPVDFKWNYRDSYDDFDNSSGEYIRKRYHHGLIAQDIEQIIKESGVDFGGYQDHTINGGCDVKSLGYDEFIAPMIKAIQELSARVIQLENELNTIK